MGEQIENSLLLTLLQYVYSYFSFHLPAIQLFISTWENIYHSIRHVSGIGGNIVIKLISFARYYLLLASNTTFMTDSQYLGAIHIWRNLNEHHYYLSSTKSVIFQIDANFIPFQFLNMLSFYIRLQSLKLI